VGVTHGDAADDVHGGDDQAGLGVAADEFAGSVHGPVEFALLDDLGAPLVGLALGDDAGVEVGVDGHLLAGHGVQGESRRHFADALGALGDDDELNDDEDQEDDHADDEAAAGDEAAEGLDDLAGVALEQDQTRGGDVEREAKQRGEQQQGREGGQFERLGGRERHDEYGDGQRNAARQEQVEHRGGQRDDQGGQDGHQSEGHDDVAVGGQRDIHQVPISGGVACG